LIGLPEKWCGEKAEDPNGAPSIADNGTNRLCNLDILEKCMADVLSKKSAKKVVIDLWDGQTAGRVVDSLKTYFGI